MTPAELHKLSFDFRAARAVYAGVELGVFEALESAPSAGDALAEKLGTNPRGLRILLDALVALELLTHDGGDYALCESAARVLVPSGDEYLGNLFLHDLWHWTSWSALDSAVRDGVPHTDRQGDRHLGNPQVLVRFLPNYNLAMEQSGRELLAPLAEMIARLAPSSILDLGGGGGALLLALLERLPEAQGVLVEHGFALEHARRSAESHPAGRRLGLLELDFEKQDIPSGHDVIVLSRVLMGFDAARAEVVVRRAAAALAPGGALVVADFDAASRVGALLSLDMLLNTGAEVHETRQIQEWIRNAGLELKESGHLSPYVGFWVARKPG